MEGTKELERTERRENVDRVIKLSLNREIFGVVNNKFTGWGIPLVHQIRLNPIELMLTIYYVERTITAGYVPLFLIRWKFPDGTK